MGHYLQGSPVAPIAGTQWSRAASCTSVRMIMNMNFYFRVNKGFWVILERQVKGAFLGRKAIKAHPEILA